MIIERVMVTRKFSIVVIDQLCIYNTTWQIGREEQ